MPYIEDIEQPHPKNRLRPSIREMNPEVAAEWYYARNCGWGPEDFSSGSSVRAWWQCSRNPKHIWQTRICQRCRQHRNCPYCFGKHKSAPVIPERSLAFLCPELIDGWHEKKNGSRTPYNVLAGSKKKAWWRCSKNRRHVWESVIKARVYGSGCPHCYDERQLDIRQYPKVFALYDKKKNHFDIRQITMNDPIWWRCPVASDHVWKTRFKPNLSCPFCRNKKCSKTNSLKTLYPQLAKQLHPTRNGDITADTVSAYSNTRVWWRCPLNPRHLWQTSVRNRTMNESNCPECWKIRRPGYFKKLAVIRKKEAMSSRK